MPHPFINANDLILFQGDSITDADRSRQSAGVANNREGLGRGYALMVAAQLLADRPADNLRFINLGVSGNRVVDLAARWKEDCLNLKPNVVSILIGVNDTWHEFSRQAGVPVAKYERIYRELLAETRQVLPGIRFVICEPFVLPCGVVTGAWIEDVAQRRAIARRLAGELGGVFVPFQSLFDDACQRATPDYWAGDGVHPTAAGHLLMTRAWLHAVGV